MPFSLSTLFVCSCVAGSLCFFFNTSATPTVCWKDTYGGKCCLLTPLQDNQLISNTILIVSRFVIEGIHLIIHSIHVAIFLVDSSTPCVIIECINLFVLYNIKVALYNKYSLDRKLRLTKSSVLNWCIKCHMCYYKRLLLQPFVYGPRQVRALTSVQGFYSYHWLDQVFIRTLS